MINYNEFGVMFELLEFLCVFIYFEVEVIVVDNVFFNDNFDCIKEVYLEVQFIKSFENLGFVGGNNLGIDVVKGEFLFFINNDIEVLFGILELFVMILQQYLNIGIISFKIKFYWDFSLIQYVGYILMNFWIICNNSIGYW